jgi:hypothetical protein
VRGATLHDPAPQPDGISSTHDMAPLSAQRWWLHAQATLGCRSFAAMCDLYRFSINWQDFDHQRL